MIGWLRRRWQLRHRHVFLDSGVRKRVSLDIGMRPACFAVEDCACGAYRWREVECPC